MTPDPAPYGADLPRLNPDGTLPGMGDMARKLRAKAGMPSSYAEAVRALDAANAEVLALRDALCEITEDPDGRTGRGCLNLHEARHIARAALLPAPTGDDG